MEKKEVIWCAVLAAVLMIIGTGDILTALVAGQHLLPDTVLNEAPSEVLGICALVLLGAGSFYLARAEKNLTSPGAMVFKILGLLFIVAFVYTLCAAWSMSAGHRANTLFMVCLAAGLFLGSLVVNQVPHHRFAPLI
jgi:hypothetical protein